MPTCPAEKEGVVFVLPSDEDARSGADEVGAICGPPAGSAAHGAAMRRPCAARQVPLLAQRPSGSYTSSLADSAECLIGQVSEATCCYLSAQHVALT